MTCEVHNFVVIQVSYARFVECPRPTIERLHGCIRHCVIHFSSEWCILDCPMPYYIHRCTLTSRYLYTNLELKDNSTLCALFTSRCSGWAHVFIRARLWVSNIGSDGNREKQQIRMHFNLTFTQVCRILLGWREVSKGNQRCCGEWSYTFKFITDMIVEKVNSSIDF